MDQKTLVENLKELKRVCKMDKEGAEAYLTYKGVSKDERETVLKKAGF